MTEEEKEKLIECNEALCKQYNETSEPELLDLIALTEIVLLQKSPPKTIMDEIEIDEVLEIIKEVRKNYDEKIFLPPQQGSPIDCYTAAGARSACDLIKDDLEKYRVRHNTDKDLPTLSSLRGLLAE